MNKNRLAGKALIKIRQNTLILGTLDILGILGTSPSSLNDILKNVSQ